MMYKMFDLAYPLVTFYKRDSSPNFITKGKIWDVIYSHKDFLNKVEN